jgi:hypothetical protein
VKNLPGTEDPTHECEVWNGLCARVTLEAAPPVPLPVNVLHHKIDGRFILELSPFGARVVSMIGAKGLKRECSSMLGSPNRG